jgi:hypothetical protein
MDIRTAAVILALLCFIGLALAAYVLRIQVPLLKVRDTNELRLVRYVLFSIVLFTVVGILILLAIDFATIFFNLRRSTAHINPVGMIVTFLSPLVIDSVLGALALMYWFIKRNNDAAARLALEDKNERR